MSHSTSKQINLVNRLISLIATTRDQNELIIQVATDGQLLDAVKQLTGIHKNGEFPSPSSSFRLRTLCLAHGVPEEYAIQCLQLLATSLLARETHPDYYDILGIEETASPEQIKKAYRKASLAHHPDHNPDDPSADESFREIRRAYEVLSDAEQRTEYDRWRSFFSSRRTSVSPSPSPSSASVKRIGSRPFYRSFGFQMAATVALLLFFIFTMDFQNLLSVNHTPALAPERPVKGADSAAKSNPSPLPNQPVTDPGTTDQPLPRASLSFAHLHQLAHRYQPLNKASRTLIVQGWKTSSHITHPPGKGHPPHPTRSARHPSESTVTTQKGLRLASNEPVIAGDNDLPVPNATPSRPDASTKPDPTQGKTQPVVPTPGPPAKPTGVSPTAVPPPAANSLPASTPMVTPNKPKEPIHRSASSKETPFQPRGKSKVDPAPQVSRSPSAGKSIPTQPSVSPINTTAAKKPEPTVTNTTSPNRAAAKSATATNGAGSHLKGVKPEVASNGKTPPVVPVPNHRQDRNNTSPQQAKTVAKRHTPQEAKSDRTRLAAVNKSKPVIETVSLREIEDRFLIFLNHYTEAFERRDFNRFISFFEPDATENGQLISSLYPQYEKNFRQTDSLIYKITINRWSIDSKSNVRIVGRFNIHATYKNRQSIQSSGSIKFLLKPHGKYFKVASLQYSFD